MLRDGDTIGLGSTGAAATVESLLSSAAVLVNGGAVRNFTNIINGFGKATGDRGQALADLIRKSNRLIGTLDARTGQISTAMTEMSRLADELDAKEHSITDLMAAAGPGTEAVAANTAELSDLAIEAGDTARLLAKFPSIGGTDTSGRSVDPRPEHARRNLQRHCGKPGYQLATDEPVAAPDDQVDFRASHLPGAAASIDWYSDRSPTSDSPVTSGFHGPHRYNWNQFIGSLKYTLWRLQERVVGRGPNSPQVPVIPDPNIPGALEVAPSPPAPGPQPPGPQR